jgi:hypothetical protein
VVKLVDAPDSKSGPARGAGSIPARGTIRSFQTGSEHLKNPHVPWRSGFFVVLP